MRKSFFAAFAILLNTLLGNSLLLLPGPLNGLCGRGSWILPLIMLPLQLLVLFVFYRIKPNGFTDALFGVLGVLACGLATALAVRVTVLLFLPKEYMPFLLLVLVLLIYTVLQCGESIYRLNLLFLLCFGILTVMFAVSALGGSVYRLQSVQVKNIPDGMLGCAVASTGLVTVPALKKDDCPQGALYLACIVAALVLSGVCAAVTACLGDAGSEVLACVTVLRQGGGIVLLRLLACALLYNLVSIKPALNCAYASSRCLGKRADICIALGAGITAAVILYI